MKIKSNQFVHLEHFELSYKFLAFLLLLKIQIIAIT